MAVNLVTPNPVDLNPVAGVRLGVAEAGIRKANRRDLTVIELAAGSRVAGVFTRNRFCASPYAVKSPLRSATWLSSYAFCASAKADASRSASVWVAGGGVPPGCVGVLAPLPKSPFNACSTVSPQATSSL